MIIHKCIKSLMKKKIIGRTPANSRVLNTKVVVPLKYLSCIWAYMLLKLNCLNFLIFVTKFTFVTVPDFVNKHVFMTQFLYYNRTKCEKKLKSTQLGIIFRDYTVLLSLLQKHSVQNIEQNWKPKIQKNKKLKHRKTKT